ncbi:MAG: MerR family transcriptional regulator [Gemmatimonadetes bacterium]|nr:MerR family transcriptional regulator [Gemmatimonadota bacterium]
MTGNLRIGEIAARCGVTRDTIRFYERKGLLDAPGRTPARHRIYDSKTVERVRFVRQLQSCGLTIGDIQSLLGLSQADSSVASRRLNDILRFRLEFIEQRITHLESCRALLIKTLQRSAEARHEGYSTLQDLPDAGSSPPFSFGRRATLR